MLVSGSNGDDLIDDMLWVFSADGQDVRIQQSHLKVRSKAATAGSTLPN